MKSSFEKSDLRAGAVLLRTCCCLGDIISRGTPAVLRRSIWTNSREILFPCSKV